MSQDVSIEVVNNQKGFEAFIRFPFQLYKNNPYWVPPIIKDELETIDPQKNPVYQNADARFFLARKNGKIVGRIAALVNWLEVRQLGKKKMRFGWFDVIDDLAVTKALFEAAEAFGKEHQLDYAEGPCGFSNLDKAGLLIYGFDEVSTMITLYNAPYYRQHLEALGYEMQAKWVEYEIKIPDFETSPEKVKRFSELVMNRHQLRLIRFQSTQQIIAYVDEMFKLLDQTYNKLQTYVPVQDYQIENYKKRFLPYVNPNYIKCIVNKEGALIAFSIIMPSFARALQKINGRVGLLGYYHLYKALRKNDKASFYLIGIRPDFQNKGLTAIIFDEMQKLFNKMHLSTVETNPELEENTAIQALWKNYEHRLHKKRATFSKSLK